MYYTQIRKFLPVFSFHIGGLSPLRGHVKNILQKSFFRYLPQGRQAAGRKMTWSNDYDYKAKTHFSAAFICTFALAEPACPGGDPEPGGQKTDTLTLNAVWQDSWEDWSGYTC